MKARIKPNELKTIKKSPEFKDSCLSIKELDEVFGEAEAYIVGKTSDEYGKEIRKWPAYILEDVNHYLSASKMNRDIILALLHSKYEEAIKNENTDAAPQSEHLPAYEGRPENENKE